MSSEWQPEDLVPLAALNQDPRVLEFLGPALSVAESKGLIDKFCAHFTLYGYGPWACVLKETNSCIGFVGLHTPNFQAAFMPCTEILWRLAADHWGRGYATEAAKRVLQAAFEDYGLSEVVSFTVRENIRSRGVMEKLGMRHDPKNDFHHPKFPLTHPLSFHVFYRLTNLGS